MFIEYFSGSDQFPMGGRNVQVNTLVYNPVSAVFENPRQLTKAEQPVCRDVKITQGIPASMLVNTLNSQMWYHYRAECRAGSLWLMETRVRNGGPFAFDNTYLLIRMMPKAKALRIIYNLPEQLDANIHRLEFTLNARRIRTIADMAPDEKNAFKKFVGETRDAVVEVTQSDAELVGWEFTQLEPDDKPKLSLQKGKSRPVAINRIRRIKK